MGADGHPRAPALFHSGHETPGGRAEGARRPDQGAVLPDARVVRRGTSASQSGAILPTDCAVCAELQSESVVVWHIPPFFAFSLLCFCGSFVNQLSFSLSLKLQCSIMSGGWNQVYQLIVNFYFFMGTIVIRLSFSPHGLIVDVRI